MYKDILQNIDNIAIWPTVSFTIFFLFFLVLIGWVVSVDKSFINSMSQKPFEDGIENGSNEDLNHMKP